MKYILYMHPVSICLFFSEVEINAPLVEEVGRTNEKSREEAQRLLKEAHYKDVYNWLTVLEL